MVIICDISAWQYWRTPPIIKNSEVPLELALAPKDAGGLGMDRRLLFPRANAREADRLISTRILTDLKSLTLPIHVMVDGQSRRTNSSLVRYHSMPPWLTKCDLLDLGGGLNVLGPVSLLETLARSFNSIDLAGAICESCGTYSLFRPNTRCQLCIDALEAEGLLTTLANNGPRLANSYWQADGKRSPMRAFREKTFEWRPTITRPNKLDNLWKRPPIAELENLGLSVGQHPRCKGSLTFKQAMLFAREGLASPLETQCALLLTGPSRFGGEELPIPRFNQAISLTPSAQKLAGTSYCVADALWQERKTVFEANGVAYHSDREGFYVKSGRLSALQSLGYTVHEMNYSQLADIEQYEAIVETICRSLGVEMQPRTASFNIAHNELRSHIFDPKRLWN